MLLDHKSGQLSTTVRLYLRFFLNRPSKTIWIFTTVCIVISLIIITKIIFVKSPKWSNLPTRPLSVSQSFFSHWWGFNLSLRTPKLQKEKGNTKPSKNSLACYKTSSIKSQLKIVMSKISRRNSTLVHHCNIWRIHIIFLLWLAQ